MTPDEARAWLRGERSMTNTIMDAEANPTQRPQTLVHIAEADAAACQLAYWVLRAEAEGLTSEGAL